MHWNEMLSSGTEGGTVVHPSDEDGQTVPSAATDWGFGAPTPIVGFKTDNLDAAAVTDQGGDPNVVRIPCTAHAFKIDDWVSIGGTVNYDGVYTVVAAAANTFDIASAFVVENVEVADTVIDVIPSHRSVRIIAVDFANIGLIGEYELVIWDPVSGSNYVRVRFSDVGASVLTPVGEKHVECLSVEIPPYVELLAQLAYSEGASVAQSSADVSIMCKEV